MNSNSDNIEWYYRLGIAYYNNLEFENACVALLNTDSLGANEILKNDECLRKDILDINDENSTTSQTSTEKGEVLRQAFQ